MDCLPGKVLGTCFTFHVLFKSWVHVCSVTHSCLTLCNPLDCCLPGSFHRIFQARIPAWIAISYSRRPSRPRDWTCVSCTSCISRWIFYHLLTYLTYLLLGRKVMTNLDSVLKSRDITLPTKVPLVKAMVFPVVMYGYKSWTLKEAGCWRIDTFELWCCRRLLRVSWTARGSNQSILKEISPGCSFKGLMLKQKLQYFDHLMWRVDSLEKTLILGGLGAGEGDNRGWDGWMASPTRWAWVWVNSGNGDGRGGWCAVICEVVKCWTWLSDWTELLFTSGRQSIQASASVLPINIQGWFTLELTNLNSLLSKGLSRISSAPLLWNINSLALSLLYGPSLTT